MKKCIENTSIGLLIMEMAEINYATDKATIKKYEAKMRDSISSNQSVHERLGDSYHVIKHPSGDRIYFRKVGDDIKEFSHVTRNNVHMFTAKGDGGDPKHIHNFIKHHINEAGHIFSSSSNTEGSKKLWTVFNDENPQYTHEAGKPVEEFRKIPKDFWYDSKAKNIFDQNPARRNQYLKVSR